MEFFERELRKLFADEKLINDPQFTGRACLGTLENGFSVKVQFHDSNIADQFDSLQVKVMNRDGNQVDKISIKLLDVLGVKTVPNNPNFKNGVEPYIWVYRSKAEWYAFRPTAADYKALQSEVGRYLHTFRSLENNRTQSMKMIYICAPLRGDIEKNIEFARQKAQEVFRQGNIPVCPHLMFPPIADATNPQQDEVARNMGLELVKRCNQVNVYGSEWTSGMWAEIKYAEQLGIPVVPEEALNKGPRQTAKKQTRANRQQR